MKLIVPNLLIRLVVVLLLGSSCSPINKKNSGDDQTTATFKADSVSIISVIRSAYDWKHRNSSGYFAFESEDSLLTGIDWQDFNADLKAMHASGVFTEDFLNRHNRIAQTLDSSIRIAPPEWRNNREIPIWDIETDEWCLCQDHPDNYWEYIYIEELKIDRDIAAITWNWGADHGIVPHTYQLTMKRIAGSWKIDELEGYRLYKTVKEYSSIMGGAISE